MNQIKLTGIATVAIIATLTQCFQFALAGEQNMLQSSRQSPFVMQERNVYKKNNGMAMICPAHKHGTPQEAMKKLNGILKTWPKDKSVSIWVCRANQVATLKMFAPMGDRIIVNPFVISGKYGPKNANIIWPSYDHPCINHIREIVDASAMKPLVACLDVNGEPNHFKKRNASFEEIKWMAYAAIGAGFKGIVWRGNTSALPWAGKFRNFESMLSQYADELWHSKGANGIVAPPGQPCSALVSENVLFIILLNPQYCGGWDKKTLILPIEDKPCRGTLTITTLPGKNIKTCKTINNRPIQLRREGEKVLLDFEYTGGGICYVIQLQSKSNVKIASSKTNYKKEVQKNTSKKESPK